MMNRLARLKALEEKRQAKIIIPKDGSDGKDGESVSGKDGQDGKDAVVDYKKIEEIIGFKIAEIPKPKDGKDGKNVIGKDGKDGRPGIVWRWDWEQGEQYSIGDAILSFGSAYICTVAHEALFANKPPTGSEWKKVWAVLAERGEGGPGGQAGLPGAQGLQGAPGVVQSVVAGTNITVDDTDPANPVISSTGGGGGGAVDSVNGQVGVVILDASDVGADVSGAASTAQSNAEAYTDLETTRAEAAEALLVPKTTTVNGHALSSNVTVSKSDVGLGSVPNTDTSTTANITDSTNKRFVTDAEKTVIDATSGANTGDQDLSGLVTKTTTVNGHALSANVTVSKSDVGLGNVDNTSDANKPVSTAQQTAIDAKVDKNGAITGATKTKITYDTKGLVTSGADATTADISDSSNKRYVTDAQLVVIGNTSGTNTGDQILPVKATGAEVDTGTNDTKFLTPKAIEDSSYAKEAYADAKVADIITDGVTTIAPSENAVFDALALKAPLASPALTGSPTAPTQTAGDNSTKLATDAFVTTAVSNAIAAVNPAIAVAAATTAAANTSGLTYNNGASGVGATLTGVANTALTIDGYTFTAVNQRILVKNDTQSPSGAFNGIYFVSQIQTALLPIILTRALDYDMPSDMNNTGAIPVVNGTANASTTWVLTSAVATVGTDPLTFTEFSLNPANLITTTTGAGGDLTGTYPNPTLAAIVSGTTVGSASQIPVITYDNKGRITGTTTASPTASTQRTFAYFAG